jgi:flagellar hook assembly protein FlgD
MPSSISSVTSAAASTSANATTVKGLTSDDFLKLMIQQLQQQDPLNPTDSNQLLTQMAQISSLQSNTQLQQTLQATALQQSIGAAGNLIGKMVNGLDDSGNARQGLVTSVKIADKKVRLELDTGADLAMENVTQVANTTSSNATVSSSQLQQIVNSLASTSGASAAASLASLLSSLSASQLQSLAQAPAASTRSSTGTLASLLGAGGS